MRLLLTICMIPCFLLMINAQEIKPEIIKVGDMAPTFTVTTLDGQIFNTSELLGKVIYLNFFATWCGPCMKEMPFIEQDIWKTIKNPDFVMLCIAREHSKEEIEKFRSEKGFTLPFAADATREIYSLFAPQYIPRNIIIDKAGKIVYTEKNFEEADFHHMVEFIKTLIN